jgi:diguanylate cyclase (GGDEF)-like protein/PAS domain S-box-containing protein
VFTLSLCALVGESLAWSMQRVSAVQRQLASKRSEERFQALPSNAAEIVAILDTAGTVSYCSLAAETVLDVRPESLVGACLWDRVHLDDAMNVERLVADSLGDHSTSHHAEFRMRHGDGTWRHMEAICRDLRHEPEVRGLVLNARDVSERKSLERELAHRAFHDTLTELPNRELLADRLGHALARAARGGQRTVLLFVDVDSFKIINDTLGHRAGDKLLVSVAQRLRASLRAGDTAARMAGDEFSVLLEDLSSVDEALSIAERFRAQLRLPIDLGQQSVVISAGIGIANTDSTDGILPDDLLRQAEVALHAAKGQGKSQIAVYSTSMKRTALDRLALEVLREACRQARVWRQTQPVMVSVNLSARQFQHPGLLEDVSAALRDSGLPPEALKLEVTESVAMDSGVGTIQTFQAPATRRWLTSSASRWTRSRSIAALWTAWRRTSRTPPSCAASSPWPARSACALPPRGSKPQINSKRCASWPATKARATSSSARSQPT